MTFKEFLRILTFHLLTCTLGYGAFYLIRELHSSDGLSDLNIPIRSSLNYVTFSMLAPSISESQFYFAIDTMTAIFVVLVACAFGYSLLLQIGVRRNSQISSGECVICILGYLLIVLVTILVGMNVTHFKNVQASMLVIAPIPMFGLSYLLKLHNQNREPKKAAKRYYRSNGR